MLSRRRGLAATCAWLALVAAPEAARSAELLPIRDVTLLAGSPLHVPLNGMDPEGRALTFAAESADPDLVAAAVFEGNRSLRVAVAGYGDMVFELFEGRVPRVTGRIVALAESGFYDGVTFHRVIDGFVIQGGDPTGTGSGGSDLGSFDDQFHVDLQHNRSGLISMAKARDDSNDSQFFVTEGPTRDLDFNHSIFGLLVKGEDVREAISGVATDGNDRPVEAVVMETVEVLEDGQNGVLVLKAPEGATGLTRVTVTATDADGVAVQQSFAVEVTPDTVNSPPFLADIPPVTTRVNTPVSFQLVAMDVEGDPARYLDEQTLFNNGLTPPVFSSENVDYRVDFDTGLVTVTPLNGVTGVELIAVATAVNVGAVDYQVVPITIEP